MEPLPSSPLPPHLLDVLCYLDGEGGALGGAGGPCEVDGGEDLQGSWCSGVQSVSQSDCHRTSEDRDVSATNISNISRFISDFAVLTKVPCLVP